MSYYNLKSTNKLMKVTQLRADHRNYLPSSRGCDCTVHPCTGKVNRPRKTKISWYKNCIIKGQYIECDN